MVTIPEIAMALVDKSASDADDEHARTVFVAGSKSVGKTTLLHTFLDKTEPVRDTLALEYSFGRKSKQRQSVCHIWEYGGGLELLAEVLTFAPRQGQLTVAAVLDLGNVKGIWSTLETCLRAIDTLPSKVTTNVIIVGGKYDLFKNYDAEVKKNICITIRSVALLYGAHVLFYSSQEPALVKKMKAALYCFGFDSGSFPKETALNPNKPLSATKGADSWKSIGIPESNLAEIKERHLSLFPPELAEVVPPMISSAQLGNVEPVIDSLKKKKYEELQMLDFVDISINNYLKTLI